MFTGIIETFGKVLSVKAEGSNRHFEIGSAISHQLKVDQSVSHDGVCLTVVSVGNDRHGVVAVRETLSKSTLEGWKEGDKVNLERCLAADGRFDGHIVQGHVDQTAVCTSLKDENGSWLFSFEYDPEQGNVTVEKGSIAVNGVSLTCFNSHNHGFTVAIIPYTYEHTNFQRIHPGDKVNLEFDIVGKYVKRLVGGFAIKSM
jgi:riboflavin synthase